MNPGAAVNAEAVIDVRGLVKRFGDKTVVDGLSLQVPRGEIFGFLGPNGSGKTTSIRMLCGLLTADEGEGRCLGHDIRRESAAIKREVGYMTQRFSFYEDLSIRENLDFVARIYQLRERDAKVDAALQRLGLQQRQSQLAGALSGGWKQRLALAACLLHEPQLLLLDEPTAGVDPKARREFWDEIHALSAEGITVLVSTHYMDEAERCTRLAYIAYGRLLAQGTPLELAEHSGLATFVAAGSGLPALRERLRRERPDWAVVPFGTELHLSSDTPDQLERELEPYRALPGLQWRRERASLEDVFIHLMRGLG